MPIYWHLGHAERHLVNILYKIVLRKWNIGVNLTQNESQISFGIFFNVNQSAISYMYCEGWNS